jgi:cytochrome c peroxidase
MPTKEIFFLGRKLFYDANLSSDGQTSCAGCHQPFAAFSTFDHDLSHGVTNSFTSRNAPALQNLAWMTAYHWDGGVRNLETQPLNPITAPNEMGETLENVLIKIGKDTSYLPYLSAAYGDTKISSERLLKSLSQFVGQLISAGSSYDKWKQGKGSLTVFEQAGYEVYKANCSSCHAEPLFTDNSFRNNGIALNRFKDAGKMNITGKNKDSLHFKTPSLRNVQLTFPYMHDGRFYSLSEVIDHYLAIDTSRNDIDPVLKKRIVMTPLQKNQLIYFMYTLTDTSFTKNPLFQPQEAVFYKH